jgi:protein-tyrosine phosphatase
MRARVLLVCTANICRSPAAARLLAGRLGPLIDVESRGTRSVAGAGMCDVSANWVLMNGGASAAGHRSRQLELADIKASTLILTASQRHRTRVIELRPSAQVRTFTLAQAARIAQWRGPAARSGMPVGAQLPDRLLWLAEELDAYRGTAPQPVPESADDLPDPHQGARHADVFGSLLAAVDAFCAPLLERPLVESALREPRFAGLTPGTPQAGSRPRR